MATVTIDGMVTTLTVAGELDHYSWPDVEDAFTIRRCSSVDSVVLDLCGVSFVSASVGHRLYQRVVALDHSHRSVNVLASPVLIRLVGLLTAIDLFPAGAERRLLSDSSRRTRPVTQRSVGDRP